MLPTRNFNGRNNRLNVKKQIIEKSDLTQGYFTTT